MGLFDEIDFERIGEEAIKKTDEKFMNKISSLTRMTDSEIKELFPNNGDAKNLAELIEIVKSEENLNNKKANIVKNIEGFSETIIKLIDRFV